MILMTSPNLVPLVGPEHCIAQDGSVKLKGIPKTLASKIDSFLRSLGLEQFNEDPDLYLTSAAMILPKANCPQIPYKLRED